MRLGRPQCRDHATSVLCCPFRQRGVVILDSADTLERSSVAGMPCVRLFPDKIIAHALYANRRIYPARGAA